LSVEIDIEHCRVNGLRVDHRQSLIDAGGGANDCDLRANAASTCDDASGSAARRP
jgi:hypothetical protein